MHKILVCLGSVLAASVAFTPFSARSATFATVYSFSGESDGAQPVSDLTYTSGNLYGTTLTGGSGFGTVFKINASGQKSTVYDFASLPDGENPYGSVLYLGNALYGTTYNGGSGSGTVFKINLSRGKEIFSTAFTGTSGQAALVGLIAVGSNLFGTTSGGGASGSTGGTLFEINPKTGVQTVLHTFGSNGDGSYPAAKLLYSNGFLYGTTVAGGIGGYGVVYKYDLNTNAETVLYSFRGGIDGVAPYSQLTLVHGYLFGTTSAGGIYGGGSYGTIFKLNIATGEENILYSFTGGVDGGSPRAGLIFQNGMFYGTTYLGGEIYGTVFMFNIKTNVETVLYTFSESDGAYPTCKLLLENGVLYGTTSSGGIKNNGTVFSLTP